ncbi:MAG TPA: DUF512 domain-containing protein [Oscillospiraceae bacterium]|nr:DUF512 domain-containing protein [Oscillospiraceae bacterium]HPF56381.1 DUF512 domain-containing protein [Clostridiales bacterium]HPK34320.1 DUF512 domain-containing protein [Oscillospiraceae bacterium]HPR75099.1 DUF512 domain-containing protein [Oscillospiraceae bacterium]
MSIEIVGVTENSICANHGVRGGDMLVSVNGHSIRDTLDYGFYTTESKVDLVFSRTGKSYTLQFVKGEYESLGLEFGTFLGDKHKGCKNKCIFCFIDQNPKGMRESIYFKDDDERLSYLLGNYITLTNLTDEEADKICQMHLSPVNVSVHTTDLELRVKMMKNPHAGEVLGYLDQFDKAGIEMNFQLVLCPGINDGKALEKSVNDLLSYQNVCSIAVIPVGLTGHREGLFPLRPFEKFEAEAVVDFTESIAKETLQKRGSRIIAAADEFYLLAQRPLPSPEFYEDYYQLENGVGMLTLLKEQFYEALKDVQNVKSAERFLIVTGEAAFPTMAELVTAYNEKFLTNHVVRMAKNRLFGGYVTVTGLLGGEDVANGAGDVREFSALLLCENMFKHKTDVFLDDISVNDLEKRLNIKIRIVQNDGAELVKQLAFK